MPEPVTIGTLATGLLLAGGKLLAEGALKEAGKSLVMALKDRLTRENGVKTLDLIDRVEQTPALRAGIEQDIDDSTAPDDPQTLELIEALRAAIDAIPAEQRPAYAIEGGTFEAGRDLIARRVEGIRNARMKAERDIDLSGAKSPGKP